MKESEDYTINVKDITMSFGKFKAVDSFSLELKKGSAMALLGQNGAGKTTLLRILAGIYYANEGQGTVLGTPLGELESEHYQRMGYVSENQKLPLEWDIQQYIAYLKPLYPNWDDEFCSELLTNFELPDKTKIGAMSRGMQMKVSLVGSLSYRPELLILDEPFSGLDPLVREEFIDGILSLMEGGEWTILLSSHDIDEVERLCDSVTTIRHGKKELSESLDSLQSRYCEWTVSDASVEQPESLDSWIGFKQLAEGCYVFTDTNSSESTREKLEQHFGTKSIESQSLSLRDIYLKIARQQQSERLESRNSA